MSFHDLSTDDRVQVIAEIGNNHEGSFDLAVELIERAKEAKADAVKFQTIIPEKLVAPGEHERIAQLRKFQFTEDQWKNLKGAADRVGIEFLSTPFDLETATMLNDLVPAFKIASGDNTFFPLLAHVARMRKPILLSGGITTIQQLRETKEFITGIWQKIGYDSRQLAILHCVVCYPTPASQAHLRVIEQLKQLGVVVGYSDHTIGINASVVAVALGAKIIEKHFTRDKQHSSFRDHQLSADPADLAELVERVREASLFLGSAEKIVLEIEEPNRIASRRSIVAARRLVAGAVVAFSDLTWLRPGRGLPPGEEAQLLGKTLKKNLEQGEIILPNDVG